MKSHNVCALAALIAALAGPAFATVSVRLDQNTLMDLRAPAGTVLVADPAVVDVSLVTPSRVAILGRGYGQTNVIITDRMGRVIFQQEVAVMRPSQEVAVYRGAQSAAFTCSPSCRPAPSPGGGAQGGGAPGASASVGGGGGGASPPPIPQ